MTLRRAGRGRRPCPTEGGHADRSGTVGARVERLERDEPQALAPCVLRSRRPCPGRHRPEPRPRRRRDGAGRRRAPGPAGAARWANGTWPEWLPREIRTQPVCRAHSPRQKRPLAALEVPVRAGAEPGAAVRIDPDEGALPVVAVEAGIRADRSPAARAHIRSEPGQRRVGVGVVEPVLDVEASAAPDDVGEGGGAASPARPRPAATCASSAGSSGATRAAHAAALAPVHRELALARLVHEIGRERAHGRGGRARRTQPRAGPRRGRSAPVIAHTTWRARNPPASRPSKPPRSASSAPNARQHSNTSATNSTLAWPRSPFTGSDRGRACRAGGRPG